MGDYKKMIAVLDTGFDSYQYETMLLNNNGYEVRIFDGDNSDLEGRLRLARNATGIFMRWTKIDKDFLAQCPQLKVISRYGVGYDNIDIDAASQAGVKVSIVRGYANHSVSDHALALIYACSRGLSLASATLKSDFGKAPFTRMFELHWKTLGIIGLGRIGVTLAGKAVHLFKKVLANDPYIPDSRFNDFGVEKRSLEQLFEESDIISVHCNLTDETRHLIDQKAFKKMKRIPIIVNTARGPVIKTKALLDSIDSGKIHSAGIDVYDTEIAESIPEKLINHPRIITTGHYAWYSENAIANLQKQATENMIALLKGKNMEDCLNN